MDPGSDETGSSDLEVVEVEGLGVAGVEAVSHVDGSAQQDQQQDHTYAHARLVGHMHLLNKSQRSMNAVTFLLVRLSPGDITHVGSRGRGLQRPL